MITWRVWKFNRFAGYVVEATESAAMRKATFIYGSGIRVERTPV